MHDRRTIRTTLAAFKGNIYQKHCPTPPFKKYINLKGLPNKKCKIFAFENRSYLGEFEAEFKKALAHESGAQGVLFDEEKKTEGRKSRDTVPLK
jgi:hypothetical protein